ncbi:hypothetical protein CKL83_27830 [Bacillus anthracis]|nr:hypothetical protein BAPAT_pXO10017 [Bacillus anthracis str. SVA11]APT29116.1 hypothetical protein BVB96_29115 [Bacillus anthracis]ARO21711.1 hypothetical protein B2J90_30415 [Bacillus cereus]EDR16359.1 hypothetical protein BAC_A0004 [Bacillus anthracis str. A0488]EDR85326.1 hypothetical protein BAQ_A0103 [Bacillus anthracis str. A0193]EDR90586.1 hypothetical protein BAH_A0201 [Bacillus anthracis str. A0442]EDS94515.1 hypothetical protein BAK_A0144 [Bacillus anthracis str. A0389]EDT16915.
MTKNIKLNTIKEIEQINIFFNIRFFKAIPPLNSLILRFVEKVIFLFAVRIKISHYQVVNSTYI